MKESLAYQEIMEEGETKAHRMDVLEVVKTRFGKRGATTFGPVLKSVHTIAQLRALHKLALKCSNLDDLMAATK